MPISVNAITNCFRIPFQPSQATFTEIGLPAHEKFKIIQKMSELSTSINPNNLYLVHYPTCSVFIMSTIRCSKHSLAQRSNPIHPILLLRQREKLLWMIILVRINLKFSIEKVAEILFGGQTHFVSWSWPALKLGWNLQPTFLTQDLKFVAKN